ncbi:unnamed protein product [Durusdinium trenchii]|uniref:Uncharacterized protein n=1 Tax=Durusdinium trenchii TaxID=1381693 RepID=A0ABP0R3L7_9DINO
MDGHTSDRRSRPWSPSDPTHSEAASALGVPEAGPWAQEMATLFSSCQRLAEHARNTYAEAQRRRSSRSSATVDRWRRAPYRCIAEKVEEEEVGPAPLQIGPVLCEGLDEAVRRLVEPPPAPRGAAARPASRPEMQGKMQQPPSVELEAEQGLPDPGPALTAEDLAGTTTLVGKARESVFFSTWFDASVLSDILRPLESITKSGALEKGMFSICHTCPKDPQAWTSYARYKEKGSFLPWLTQRVQIPMDDWSDCAAGCARAAMPDVWTPNSRNACSDIVGAVAVDAPQEAYSASCLAGENTPPMLQAMAVNPGNQHLLLTAVDEDGKPAPTAEAPPLWAVANIGVSSANELHKGRGDVVVPYSGPNIQDDFIHRIFFRVYEQPYRVPQHLLRRKDVGVPSDGRPEAAQCGDGRFACFPSWRTPAQLRCPNHVFGRGPAWTPYRGEERLGQISRSVSDDESE